MQRDFQRRTTLNYSQPNKEPQSGVGTFAGRHMRDTQSSHTLHTQASQLNQASQQNQPSNLCLIPPKKHINQQEQQPNEDELLIQEYNELSIRLREIRGKLYRVGIDPENLN